jgi:tetratricopeptide (TPR) repeat protein
MTGAARSIATTLLLAYAPAAQAQSTQSVNALRRWIDAVRAHAPGQADAAAGVAAGFTYADRLELNPAMQLFLKVMRGEAVATRTDAQRRTVELFRSVRAIPGPQEFVRRAAILHTDAAIFSDHFPAPPDDAPAPQRTAAPGRRLDPPPALLSNDRYMMHTDGRVIGEQPANWNWPFARSLLDLALGGRASQVVPDDRSFVIEWYHAVASYLFAVGNQADLRGHLQHAEALGDDARLLFDRGCFAETLGLSYNQALRDDAAFWDAKRHVNVDLPSEEKTDGDAERFFRRALDIDPAFAEARVRLARLLERRARFDEAATQLAQAQASERVVAFYGHLVGGRVAQEQGRFTESIDHYAAAAKLYPDAQSALVGASQAAVMAADVPRALSLVQMLGERSQRFEADPWRYYSLGPGRDANDLMAALWARVKSR